VDPDREVIWHILLDDPQGSGDLGYSLIAGSNAIVGLQQVNCVATFDEILFLPTNRRQVLPDEEFQVITAAHNHPPRSSLLKSKAHALVSKLPPRPIIAELTAVIFRRGQLASLYS
jgi:hypothetical protein